MNGTYGGPACPAPLLDSERVQLGHGSGGKLSAALLRDHYAFDRRRFLAPRGDSEAGYAAFLGSQLHRDDTFVAVAERDGQVLGYVYAGIEPLSWKELRGPAGFPDAVVRQDLLPQARGDLRVLPEELGKRLNRRRERPLGRA